MALAVVLLALALTGAQELTAKAGQVSVTWHPIRGTTISYRGITALDPYADEFTPHDPAWSKTYYRHRRGHSTAKLVRRAKAVVIEASDDAEHF